METNIYTFKVTFYGDRNLGVWYPPIEARTYQQAIDKVYSNETIESATLKVLVTPTGETVTKFGTPGNYDIKTGVRDE